MKHKHPHSRNEYFAEIFRKGFENYKEDFIVDGATCISNLEVLKKIKDYSVWLDELGVSSVMMLCEPSINSLCLLYSAVLSSRTILILQPFMSNHLIIDEFTRLDFDLLVMDKAYVEKRRISNVVRLVYDTGMDFFYKLNRTPKKYSILPGLLFYTANDFHKKKICHYHYSVLAKKIKSSASEFHFSSSDVFMLNEQVELFSWLCSVFMPLCLGGKLILVNLAKRHNVSYLISIIQQHGVSVAFCFTGVFLRLQKKIIAEKNGVAIVSLQKLFLFGDFPRKKEIQQWFTFIYPKTRIYHLLSSTEYLAPFYKVLTKEVSEAEHFCLGSVSSDSDYALVEFEKSIYELFVTGSLCTGYMDLMESLQHLGSEKGKLFFKTGILVSINENSLIYYAHVSRVIKKQDKFINLDEIEHKFNDFYPKDKCAVISDLKGSIYMFIEGSNNAEDMYKLKLYLNETLPSYMHVNFYDFMPKLPKTRLGGIDYYALQTDLLAFFKKYFVAGRVDRNILLSDLGLSQLDYLELSEYAMLRTGRYLDLSYNQAGFRLKDIPTHLFPVPKPANSNTDKVSIGAYHLTKFIKPFLHKGLDGGGFIFRYPLAPQISFYKLKISIIDTINNHFMLSTRVVNHSGTFYWARVKPNEDIIIKNNWLLKRQPLIDEELKININSPQLVKIYLEKIKNKKYLIISYHQIVLDDWSLNQLLFEIFARYQDRFLNQMPNLSLQAFYLNQLGQPFTRAQKDITNLVKIIQRFPHINIQSLTPVFSIRAPHFSSIIVIPKNNVDRFKMKHNIVHEPNSSVFLTIMYLCLSKALSVESLIIHLTLFNRISPCYFSSQLLFNCQTYLPLLVLPHSQIKKQTSYITMILSYYFHHMDLETIKHFYHNEQVKSWLKEQVSNDYKILFSYVPSTKDKSQFQSQLIEWSGVQSQLTDDEQGRISFRVCEMDQQFIVHLDTKLIGGIHSDIVTSLKEVFD